MNVDSILALFNSVIWFAIPIETRPYVRYWTTGVSSPYTLVAGLPLPANIPTRTTTTRYHPTHAFVWFLNSTVLNRLHSCQHFLQFGWNITGLDVFTLGC